MPALMVVVIVSSGENIGISMIVFNILSLIPISRALSKIGDLPGFCDTHGLTEKEMMTSLNTVVRTIMIQHLNELENAWSIGIEGSEEFRRSYHYVNHPDRPKDGLLDRLSYCTHMILRQTWKVTSVDELLAALEGPSKDYIALLESYTNNNVILLTDGKKEKIPEEVLEIASCLFFADALLNPRYSHVLSNYVGMFAKSGRREYFERNWKGYVVVTLFLYKMLLEKYYGSSYADEIGEAKNADDMKSIGYKLWRDALSKIDSTIGVAGWEIQTIDTIDLTGIEDFLDTTCPDHSISIQKDLDAFFGYHQIKLHDGRTKFFAGPVMFIRLLLGELEYRKINNGLEEEIQVARIRHPIPDKGYRFSYGILTWSNPPGWIIFTWCGNDYSGGSTKTMMEIEKNIKVLSKHVDIREYIVSQNDLERYALGKMTSPKGPIHNLTEEEGRHLLFHASRELSEKVSGILMELIVAVLYAAEGYLINWAVEDSVLGDYEVDITACKDDECLVIECSHRMSASISFAEGTIREFGDKIERLTKMENYDGKKFSRIYVTRSKHISDGRLKDVREHLESHDISIVSIEDLIGQSQYSERHREKIKEIIKTLDCWRPGYGTGTTDSEVLDVLTCLDTKDLPELDIDEILGKAMNGW